MQYIAIADTDIGISKNINQDSVLIKHAKANGMEILMAIICDGMGGLSFGELASATVIRGFSKWFDEELPYELENLDMQIIGAKWSLLLKDLNLKILDYSKYLRAQGSGTTFSGILFVGDEYVIGHVGDTRIYEMGTSIKQLTTDHTFIAREIKSGRMTLEEAMKDRRRNMLLQCIGASRIVNPDILYGKAKKGGYLICSDGFRHEISKQEICERLNPKTLKNKNVMHQKTKELIELAKERREKDNISVIVIKAE